MALYLATLRRDDPDLAALRSIHREPSVRAFFSVAEGYFDYVTGTSGVLYQKIMLDNTPIGGIHSETDGDKVASRHLLQKCGFAEAQPEDGLIPCRCCRATARKK